MLSSVGADDGCVVASPGSNDISDAEFADNSKGEVVCVEFRLKNFMGFVAMRSCTRMPTGTVTRVRTSVYIAVLGWDPRSMRLWHSLLPKYHSSNGLHLEWLSTKFDEFIILRVLDRE